MVSLLSRVRLAAESTANLSEDYACSRYNHAYPLIVNEDERLGDNMNRKFQFKSCSGAVIDDVLRRQIPAIDSNQQVILLSAGMCVYVRLVNGS